MVVRVDPTVGASEETVEVWFATVNPYSSAIALRLIDAVPAPSGVSAGCVVRNGTRLMWQVVERELDLYRLTKDGLDRVGTFREWEDPVAAGMVRGSLVFVARSALGVIDLDSVEAKRHERITLVAAIEHRNGDVYSAIAVDGDVDPHGFPSVKVVRETINDAGTLSLLATTDSWPMMEAIGRRRGDALERGDFEPVNYSLVATLNEVVLLRNYFFGRSQLVLRSWTLGTLDLVGDYEVDVENAADVFGGLNAGTAGEEVLAGVSTMNDGAERVRVLHMHSGVVSRESVAPELVPNTPVVIQDIVLFNLGQRMYAVSTQQPSGTNPAFVAIDAFLRAPHVRGEPPPPGT